MESQSISNNEEYKRLKTIRNNYLMEIKEWQEQINEWKQEVKAIENKMNEYCKWECYPKTKSQSILR